MEKLNSEKEDLIWVAPEYKNMLPLLRDAHVEIQQLRYAIEQGGLKLNNKIKRDGVVELTDQITRKEEKAILGMLIKEGNNRLQEIAEIKSYLEAVELDNMIVLKSGYLDPKIGVKGIDIKFNWSPSGLLADVFNLDAVVVNGEVNILDAPADMDIAMFNSIDKKQLKMIITDILKEEKYLLLKK